jgi:hypothetical protein
MGQIEQKVEQLLAEFGFRTFVVFGSGFNVEARFFDSDGKLKPITIFGPAVGTDDDLRCILKRECQGIPCF